MAFPASSPLLADELARARNEASKIRTIATSIKTASLAGDVPRQQIITFMGQLNNALGVFNATRSTPNIGAYAQTQLGSPTLDINVEFTAMMTATSTLRDWIFANFPKDGSGAWLVQSYDNSGAGTQLVFTTSQLAQFRTNVDALIATIS